MVEVVVAVAGAGVVDEEVPLIMVVTQAGPVVRASTQHSRPSRSELQPHALKLTRSLKPPPGVSSIRKPRRSAQEEIISEPESLVFEERRSSSFGGAV